MPLDRNGLEVLTRRECLALVATQAIGRVAFTSAAIPIILPVNFFLDKSRILIRTTPGTKLDAAMTHSVVAFEVDDVDLISHSGWSVSITGMSTVVSDLDDLRRIGRLPLARWAPASADNVIAISTELVSGRRIARYGLLTA